MSDTDEKKKSDALRSRISEGVILLLLSIASYIFAFSSQRAYLNSFGIDDLYVSVELDAVVRTGVGLVASVIVFMNLLHMPYALYTQAFKLFIVFRLPIFITAILFYPVFASTGVSWFTVIVLALVFLILSFQLVGMIQFIRTEGSFDDFIQREIKIEKDYLAMSADQKLADFMGGRIWPFLVLFTFVPFVVGSIVGGSQGNRKTDFLTFKEDDGNYAIVHRISGAYIAVGYEDRGGEPSILDARIKFLEADDLADQSLEKRNFDDPMLRSEGPDKQTYKDWYGKEIAPLFVRKAAES